LVAASRSCVSASCATRNRTACSFTAWLASALVGGRGIMLGSSGAKDAVALAAKVITNRNRRLCGRIVEAAATCPIIIDCSSLLMRAGFSIDAAPSAIFPSAVCRWCGPNFCPGMGWRADWIGNEALEKTTSGNLNWRLSLPVQNGFVTNWDDMELLWHHTFVRLNVLPHHQPLLLTEAIMNPKAAREKMVQIMFETFSVPALYTCSRPVLRLLASRRSTGVVVHCGDGADGSIVPIVDGQVLPHAMSRARFHSGDDLTNHMITLLQQRENAIPALQFHSASATRATRSFVRGLRQALCYVALDYALEMQAVTEATYEPPAQPATAPAAAICIGSERFACPEMLFRPLQPTVAGMHTATDAAIKACDASIQQQLYSNIVLAGSALALPGMAERMAQEMRAASAGMQVSVSAAARHSAWAGGALLAASPAFVGVCMLKSVYDEHGPTIVHTKCPACPPL
jgi:actin-related protein